MVLFFVNNCKYLCGCLSYSNQTWYQDTPLHHLSAYQISRQSNNPSPLYDNLNTFMKKNEDHTVYLRNTWHDLVEIWNVRYWRWRASPKLKSSSFIEPAQSHVYAKIAALFFLSIYSRGLRTGFLGRTTYYHVSWFLCHNFGFHIIFTMALCQSHTYLQFD